jgi:hypothetical protein
MKAAEEIFIGKTYPKEIQTLQRSDKISAFDKGEIPAEFVLSKTMPGRIKGLTVILDAHSNLFSPGFLFQFHVPKKSYQTLISSFFDSC